MDNALIPSSLRGRRPRCDMPSAANRSALRRCWPFSASAAVSAVVAASRRDRPGPVPLHRVAAGGRSHNRPAWLGMAGWMPKIVGLFLLLASSVGADAPASVRAGWIDSFDGSAAGYVLRRGGQVLPVQYFMPLLEGDRIEIRAADGLVRVRLGEDAPLVLNHDKSPFKVPRTGAAPSVWGNLMTWASGWFTELHDESAPARRISAVSKGEAVAGPASGLLFTEIVGLSAGRRPLALAWRGGTAPFSVMLSGDEQGAEPLIDLTDISVTECLTPEVDLSPGQYLLEIRDGAGKHLISDVAVVDTAEVPRPEPGAVPGDLPEEAVRTVTAAWLAGQQGGWVWRLEAYQAIAGAGTYAPAVLLREALITDSELPSSPAFER